MRGCMSGKQRVFVGRSEGLHEELLGGGGRKGKACGGERVAGGNKKRVK